MHQCEKSENSCLKMKEMSISASADGGPRSRVRECGTLHSTKFPHFPVKIGLIGGVEGIPQISFSLDSYYFCYLGARGKF